MHFLSVLLAYANKPFLLLNYPFLSPLSRYPNYFPFILSHSDLTAIDFSSLLSYSGITGTGIPEFNRMEAFYVSARKRISGGCLFSLPKNR